MNLRYGLLFPAMFVALLLVGSASAVVGFVCPDTIPSPPYNPKFPEEDIIKVEAYLEAPNSPSPTGGYIVLSVVRLTVTFAAPTPPTGQEIHIIATEFQGSTETVIGCSGGPVSPTTIITFQAHSASSTPNIMVYAWLGAVGATDRAPNGGSYPITSLSAAAPNQFYDYEGTVGGVVSPVNKLALATPFLALAGLIVAVSAVVAVKKRRD